MTVKLELTDGQARELIRTASIYAREYAGKYKQTGDRKALAASKRLDAARFELEGAVEESVAFDEALASGKLIVSPEAARLAKELEGDA